MHEKFHLPPSMNFYYMQLRHDIVGQGRSSDGILSPTSLFSLIKDAESAKGFISQCYAMLLQSFLKKHPLQVLEKWEKDVGQLTGNQWEEAFQSVTNCSLNVTQRLTQLYILLGVYYTPHRLYVMGLLPTPTCSRCRCDHSDLIHLLY